MPLERLTDPESLINVKGLSVEAQEPEPTINFDPNRDLTESDWQSIHNYLVQLGDDDELYAAPGKFLQLAACLAKIDPQRESELINEKRLKIIEFTEAFIAPTYSRKELRLLQAETVARVNSLYPKTFQLSENQWKDILADLSQYSDSSPEYLELFSYLATIDRSRCPAPKDASREAVDEYLMNEREKKQGLGVFPLYASQLLTIDPSHDFHLNEDDWRAMKGKLNRYRLNDRKNFIEQAADLAVIARAEQLQAAKRHSASDEPLPAVRNF